MNKCYMSVQWHITESCLGRCKHCYMQEKEKELSKEEILKILSNLEEFEKNQNFAINNFAITGGDPLLSKNFEFILSELKKRGKNISIMGTPDTISEKSIEILKKYDIENIQLSLDGLEETHDYMRGKGSFKKTLIQAKFLQESGIKVNIMFTVTNNNYIELIPLMSVIVENQIDSFSFDFLCPIGEGKNLSVIAPEESYKLLNNYLNEKERFERDGTKTFFHEKSSLLRLVRETRGEYSTFSTKSTQVVSGCYVGFTSFAISAGGYFMACRRLGKKMGNLLNETLEDIFFESELLKKYRRPEYFKNCGKCKMFKFCRGCPAVAIGESRDEFSKVSYCFSNSEDVEYPKTSLEIDKSKERELISNHMFNIFNNEFKSLIKRKEIQDLIFLFLFEETQKLEFFKNPKCFLEELNVNVTDREIELCRYYLELYREGLVPSIIQYIFGEKIW
ncbi:MAG: radical SAM protein [Fusobacteriaceae bacterium]